MVPIVVKGIKMKMKKQELKKAVGTKIKDIRKLIDDRVDKDNVVRSMIKDLLEAVDWLDHMITCKGEQRQLEEDLYGVSDMLKPGTKRQAKQIVKDLFQLVCEGVDDCYISFKSSSINGNANSDIFGKSLTK